MKNIIVVLVLVLCSTQSFAMSAEENAKAVIVQQLVDPESAKFSNITVYHSTLDGPSVCGFVNAKNSYGGYSGKQLFIVNKQLATVVPLWLVVDANAEYCRDKKGPYAGPYDIPDSTHYGQ